MDTAPAVVDTIGVPHRSDWFFLDKKNAEVGPFPLSQMRLWVSSGVVGIDVKVRQCGGHPSSFAPIWDWYPDDTTAFFEEPLREPSNFITMTTKARQDTLQGKSPSVTVADALQNRAPSPSESWYYQDGSMCQVGPLSVELLERWLALGQINQETLVWNIQSDTTGDGPQE